LNNPFALFELPLRFELDREALDAAYRRVQSAVHPDRFATASERDRRLAVQWSSAANEAMRILRDPIRRASWLCEHAGYPIKAESNTAMGAAFLHQQMAWREALDDARDDGDPAALADLRRALDASRARLQGQVGQAIEGAQWESAVAAVREWMFVERFAEDVEALEFALD